MAKDKKITSKKYPYLKIRINLRGKNSTKQALVDTGFTGHVAIPENIFNGNLGLPDARTDWQLADGSIASAPLYLGTIEIVGLRQLSAYITVLGNEHIIGRGVLDRFKLTLDHAKKVTAEA